MNTSWPIKPVQKFYNVKGFNGFDTLPYNAELKISLTSSL
jgi:hypothetical protein